MPASRRLLGLAVTGIATAVAVTTGVVVERRVVTSRRSGALEAERLGGLRGNPCTVQTDDGVDLYAEVDQVAPYDGDLKPQPGGPTLVFVHGYALNLDCWHFQREFFRGKHRMVFYDQRSHGRSARSPKGNATVDQLGLDLKTVLDALAPQGPVVLIGHSMGGMTILALAEQHPELFGSRVVGAALVSTTAGGIRTSRIVAPFVPDVLAGQLTPRLLAGLARAPELVDSARKRGSNIGYLVTDRFAFGGDVPASYVEFVDQMLAGTTFDVLAEFFPNFDTLDKYSVLHAFANVPTLIMCGTKDRLTSAGHSRKMASRIPGAELVECEGAGHMAIMESKDKVNAALERFLSRVDRSDRSSRAS
jgi:pimeloyl-ACP methyl ester carboxylesterase